MKADKQTSKHLLLAVVNTVFSIILILTIIVMSWEPWMVPLVAAGCVGVWVLHISRSDQAKLYENLSTGLMLVEFLFFGAHSASLFDVPAVACIIVFVFSMLDRKRLLYITAALYVTVLLYHCLILHTVVPDMQAQEVMRLVLGGVVVFGSVGVARYRVDRRLAEQQRYTRVLEQLETSGRENVVLLSNVSHEFRTPINMVMGISEIILEKDIPPEIREDIKSIQLAGKRLSNHISNILDYTEIAEGSLTPAQEEYMITSVLMDVVTTTAIQSAKHQLELVFDIDPDVPAVLVGDAEKITHVMKALLENSIKFTEEGGISVSIGYRQEIYGVNLLIDIIDTGIGMTAAQLTQMYDDFYQADSGSSRFAGGLGLGIPIVRGLLHAMGGFIHFESLGQQGLQAHISIPQGVADDSPSLSLAHADELCVACYFRPEKYNSDEVRRFYDKLIVHLVEGLGIEGYQAHNFEGLLKLQRSHPLTHIVIAQAEYEENRCYYEELTNKLRVVIIAEKDYVLDRNSRLLVIRKPFSAISVVNLFNGEVEENGFKEAQAVGDRPFTCEGVRVLVVDDEEMNLVVAKGVLGSYGIQVDICLSGKEALELCVSNRYDIIFLDHMRAVPQGGVHRVYPQAHRADRAGAGSAQNPAAPLHPVHRGTVGKGIPKGRGGSSWLPPGEGAAGRKGGILCPGGNRGASGKHGPPLRPAGTGGDKRRQRAGLLLRRRGLLPGDAPDFLRPGEGKNGGNHRPVRGCQLEGLYHQGPRPEEHLPDHRRGAAVRARQGFGAGGEERGCGVYQKASSRSAASLPGSLQQNRRALELPGLSF